jgi:hypothetical protein
LTLLNAHPHGQHQRESENQNLLHSQKREPSFSVESFLSGSESLNDFL